jgi:hypothetical protein
MRALPISKNLLHGPDSRAPSARRCRLLLLGSNELVCEACQRGPLNAWDFNKALERIIDGTSTTILNVEAAERPDLCERGVKKRLPQDLAASFLPTGVY